MQLSIVHHFLTIKKNIIRFVHSLVTSDVKKINKHLRERFLFHDLTSISAQVAKATNVELTLSIRLTKDTLTDVITMNIPVFGRSGNRAIIYVPHA